MKKRPKVRFLVPFAMTALVVLAITALVFPASAASPRSAEAIRLSDDLRIDYDLSYEWTIDTSVDWQAVDVHEFDVIHTARITREPVPDVVPNSSWIRGTIAIDDPQLRTWNLAVNYRSEFAESPCIVNPLILEFVCQVDTRTLQTDPKSGRPTERATVIVTTGDSKATFSVDWQTVEPSHVYREDGWISNHSSMAPDGGERISLFSSRNRYREQWDPVPGPCESHEQIFELNFAVNSSALPRESASSTLTWCRPRPGYTVQYLGGPFGTPLVVASIQQLRRNYPNLLGPLPPLTSREEVRTLLGSLFCRDSCRLLLQANFMAAAINALDPLFAEQTFVIGTSCVSVTNYLQELDRESPVLTNDAITINKSILDRINSALLTTCPRVTTTSSRSTGGS